MAYIEKLNQYQLEISKKIMSNENILQGIVNNADNFYNHPLPVVTKQDGNSPYENNGIIFSENGQRKIDKSKLLFNLIFPWQHIEPETNNKDTLLTFHFPAVEVNRNITAGRNNYKTSCITFTIYSRPSLLPLENGTLRTLFIASEIDKMFSGKPLYHSTGSAHLYDWGNISLLEGYWLGHTLTYQLTDIGGGSDG